MPAIVSVIPNKKNNSLPAEANKEYKDEKKTNKTKSHIEITKPHNKQV